MKLQHSENDSLKAEKMLGGGVSKLSCLFNFFFYCVNFINSLSMTIEYFEESAFFLKD